ncbi:MAG: cob(I)yrinic acid a,c-diamide adenosyltransferase [Nitrosopumilaceae archaeon]|nr:cob(I)yrinic acid a,c-diamide adenosyltransferase [Nitrosopumilaceae archaeon]
MEKGLIIVYTGNGKGKTTAALGLVLRAIGYKQKVCMIQFIKGSWHYGEMYSANILKPEFELVAAGKGFVGIIDDSTPLIEHKKIAQHAIEICKKKIQSNKYNTVILDEINYAINMKLIKLDDLIKIINSKPYEQNLVLTGNYVKNKIIDLADIVTEMKEIKHPFKFGIKAKKGIDF